MNPSHEATWNDLNVAISHDEAVTEYPPLEAMPFDPGVAYPEYTGPVAPWPNQAYAAVRTALRALDRDRDNDGRRDWNPLQGIVEPGMNVVIKPNLVADTVRAGADLEALFTNMSVVRPVLDYVRLGLRGSGRIVLGDAPIQRTDWQNLMEVSGVAATLDRLNNRGGPPIELVDFRREVTVRDRFDMAVKRETRPSTEFVEIDLGEGSTLTAVTRTEGQFRVSLYRPDALTLNHNQTCHRYVIHRKVMDADLLVGIPKLKVHKKAGMTAALKNLVGIVCGKDWLPHYRIGHARNGAGDQYEESNKLAEVYSRLCDEMETGVRLKRRACSVLAAAVRQTLKRTVDPSCEGSWHGNDTTWRMVHDLNLCLCYASSSGAMTRTVQRRAFHVVDGIIGGEGEGPLQPSAKRTGTILAGTNPMAVDLTAATIMGFDIARVPLLRDAWRAPAAWQLPPLNGTADAVSVRLASNDDCQVVKLRQLASALNFCFLPARGWIGHIEGPDWCRSSTGLDGCGDSTSAGCGWRDDDA